MKPLRSSRHLIKNWHRGEKAIIDHLIGQTGDTDTGGEPSRHSPFTASGQAIEAQIRKAWPQNQGGLPIF